MMARLRKLVSAYSASRREEAVALTVLEVKELENIFALLLLGALVGFPAPPTMIAVELLPFMEEELSVLEHRAEDSGDMFAEMLGTLGID